MARQRDSRSPAARRAPAHPLARNAGAGGGAGPRRGGGTRRPLPPGEQFFTPSATGLRKELERRSAAPLVFLFQLPRWILPVVLVVLLLVGFAVPSWPGGLAALAVLAFVAWLAYMSWPSLGLKGRLLRVAAAAFLILLVLDRFGAF
ncbi:hypothetical protein HNP84_002731 [Thermocatellispora tengchongensis]|uniref:Uncharacterized protein n=1 Tax=Thermocatellispora tengchongensis TaxID=1073253 RepID=A0A840P6B6_9ACTN|nr:DUF6703 family protein [Thermocatellispora tengchongensis]MBB5133010.1 hypothetical protein [Thermocatellispora tengchongensis]